MHQCISLILKWRHIVQIHKSDCLQFRKRWYSLACLLLVVAAVTSLPGMLQAAVPSTVSYQGRLTTPGDLPVANGNYSITFRIYDDSIAGNLFWQEVKTVPVVGGLFSVQLGQATPLDQSTLSMSNLFIATKVGSDPEMTPRARLTSVPYAVLVSTIDGANGGMVTGDITSTGQVSGSRSDASGGYFQTFDAGNPNSFGVVGKFTVTGQYNGTGVYGYSVPADWFGVGGKFVGGWTGVEGSVIGSGTSNLDYRGVTGTASTLTSELNATMYGVYGIATNASQNYGVYGVSQGISSVGDGFYYGLTGLGNGLGVKSHNYGVWAKAQGGAFNTGIVAEGSTRAALFIGDVQVQGTLSKYGGSFKIDHPLDPANKYLQHSFVESPDMMNIYNGNTTLDAEGNATVTMPAWFEPLNRDFRYQLTAIGAPAPNLYVSREVQDNQFSIAGGSAGMKVSWQVTGVRQDAWANANRIQVEVPKDPSQVGTYLTPELFNKPTSMGEAYQMTKEGDEAARKSAASNERISALKVTAPPQK
jgi:hypothetical protein